MKKYLLLFLIIPALLSGCSSDPDEIIAESDLTVDSYSLEFPSGGGKQVLKVTAQNVDGWDAYSNISWIKLGEPDLVNGTLEVTVDPTEEIRDLEGRIVIHTDSKDVVNISVRQSGHGIIHDRNWLSRMNLHGPIESMNFYFNPIFLWEADPGFMYDVEINAHGNPTRYGFWKMDGRDEDGKGMYYASFAEVTYDSRNRVETVSVETENTLGDGNTHEFKVTFVYGNHGKYIETDHLFFYLNDNFYFDINHRMLLPAMMKDLVRIDIWNTGLIPRDLSMVFDIQGDTGSVTWTRTVDNEYRETPVFDYTFTNGYSSLEYDGFFIGFPVRYYFDYEVDPRSGNILGAQYYFSDEFLLVERKFHDNLQNSMYHYYDGLWYGYYMSIEYDENYNVTGLTDTSLGLGAEFRYSDYDQYGNWTKVSDRYTSHGPTFEIFETREINYYQ